MTVWFLRRVWIDKIHMQGSHSNLRMKIQDIF